MWVQAGRDPEPSLAIIDSASRQTTRTSGQRGYDAGKKNNGIKRHFLVDAMGLVLCVVVLTANIQDRDGAKILLAKAAKFGLTRLKIILGDDGYSGPKLAEYVLAEHGWKLVSVKRTQPHQFQVIPKRWIVERTIGWTNNFRGLSKHYDHRCETSEAKVLLASIFYMTKRLTTTPDAPKWSIENEQKLKMKLEKAAEKSVTPA